MPRHVRPQYPHHVLIVCNDTGAANAFTVCVKNWSDAATKITTICVDYAANVFKKNGITPTKESPKDYSEQDVIRFLDELHPDAVLLGTSFDSWTERFFCKHAQTHGIYCVGFVDWWSNFGARFSTPHTNDLAYVPDAIAVMDNDAIKGCIADGLPKKILHLTGNPYWDDLLLQKQAIEQLRRQVRTQLGVSKDTLLAMVFSSNIRNLPLNLGYDEYTFWEALVPLPKKTSKGIPVQWALKPHPREKNQDTMNIIEKFDIDPLVVDKCSAIEAVAASDVIIGMCSSVLFEAALLGKKVVSLQPGLTTGKLEYLRIFHHIGVPTVIKISEVNGVVTRLLNDEVPYPNLAAIPPPIGNGTAVGTLQTLLRTGMKKT